MSMREVTEGSEYLKDEVGYKSEKKSETLNLLKPRKKRHMEDQRNT